MHRTLTLALAEASLDAIRSLTIDRIEPGKNKRCLEIRLCRSSDLTAEQQQTIREQLRQMEGWLSSEIAVSITRKRVPRLRFEFSAASSDREDGHDH